jgi:hypothetical protein
VDRIRPRDLYVQSEVKAVLRVRALPQLVDVEIRAQAAQRSVCARSPVRRGHGGEQVVLFALGRRVTHGAIECPRCRRAHALIPRRGRRYSS